MLLSHDRETEFTLVSPVPLLSKEEQVNLRQLETLIEVHKKGFLVAARAIATIRERKLYPQWRRR